MTTTSEHPCIRCRVEPPRVGKAYCQTCLDQYDARERAGRTRQLGKLIHDPRNSLMRGWTLATFPAADPVGRAALENVEPWLWAHTYHRIADRGLVKVDESDPELLADHPIWRWLYVDHLPNLYLWGSVGSGKTGLAWSLLRARVELNFDWEEPHEDPAWANVVELLDKAKAAMSAGESKSPIRALYDASVLVLDDLGAERPTDWARDAIAALVQHRHTRQLPTIVTSNYAPSALAKRLGHDDPMIGQRIVSRLTENCVKVKLDRADQRLKRAAA